MSACEILATMTSGLKLCLRPIHPGDKALIRGGISELSDRSRYLRFFSGVKTMPEPVIERLTAVDGVNHIAWGALDMGNEPYHAIAAVHAIRAQDTETAEIALAVLDDYHGQGVARLLLLQLVADCREAGLTMLIAETLAENKAANRLFRSLGGLTAESDGPVVRYRFDIETIWSRLKASQDQVVHQSRHPLIP